MSKQTEPVFDANGWCSDMTKAPKDGRIIQVFDPRNLNNIPDYRGWKGPAKWSQWGYWRKMHRRGFVNMMAEPTHWKPLGPGPVGT